jgi:hypothetical protein
VPPSRRGITGSPAGGRARRGAGAPAPGTARPGHGRASALQVYLRPVVTKKKGFFSKVMEVKSSGTIHSTGIHETVWRGHTLLSLHQGSCPPLDCRTARGSGAAGRRGKRARLDACRNTASARAPAKTAPPAPAATPRRRPPRLRRRNAAAARDASARGGGREPNKTQRGLRTVRRAAAARHGSRRCASGRPATTSRSSSL